MRRRHRSHLRKQHNNHVDRWTVSYADYMTLMFALFVVLYAMLLNRNENYQQIIEAVQSVGQFASSNKKTPNNDDILIKETNDIIEQTGAALLRDTVSSRSLEGQGDLIKSGGDVDSIEHQNKDSILTQLPIEALSNHSGFYQGQSLITLQRSLEAEFKSELAVEQVNVDLDGDWLTIEMSGPLLFAAESHTLLNGAIKNVERIAKILTPINNMIRLRGYTDTHSVSNELYKSNWELSVMRAISVVHALNKLGIVGERMVVEGFGQYQPFFDKNGEVDEFKSRRVVIAISKFALFNEKKIDNSINIKASTKEKKEVQEAVKPDSEDMQEIYLPDGRLIITTRQE